MGIQSVNELAIIILSVALVVNLYPILSILMFPTLRKHVFNQVLLNICSCTFFMNLSNLIALSGRSNAFCIIGRLGSIYFESAMQFWAATLIYLTYKVFECEKATISPKLLSFVNWGYPAVTIGMLFICGKMDLSDFCSFMPSSSHDRVSLSALKITFLLLPMFTLEAFSLFLTCNISYRYFVLKLMSKQVIWKIVSKLLIYQLVEAFFVIGLIAINLSSNDNTVSRISINFGKSKFPLNDYVLMAGCLLGPVYSLVFFCTNRESRMRWGIFACSAVMCCLSYDKYSISDAWKDLSVLKGDSLERALIQEQIDLSMKETELSTSRQDFSNLSEYKRDSDINSDSPQTNYDEISNASILADAHASFLIFGGGE